MALGQDSDIDNIGSLREWCHQCLRPWVCPRGLWVCSAGRWRFGVHSMWKALDALFKVYCLFTGKLKTRHCSLSESYVSSHITQLEEAMRLRTQT